MQSYIDTAIDQMHLELFREVQCTCQVLSPMLNDALWPAGKALRPIMALSIALLFTKDPVSHPGLMSLCKALECLHIASLLHDDVVDAGVTRRYRPCLYRIWGYRPAILLGDYLLSIALKYLLESNNPKIIPIVQSAMAEMALGQIQEESMSWSKDINHYETIATQKTGMLFSAAAQCVCILLNIQGVQEQALTHYGQQVGLCFQLKDDLQDYSASQKDKQPFQDYFQSRITAPILWLMKHACAKEQVQLKIWWRHPTSRNAQKINALMQKYHILEYGMEIIKKRKEKICHILESHWTIECIRPLIMFF